MADINSFTPLWGAWEIDGVLGEGSFGRVYRVRREDFGRAYYSAVKHISIPSNQGEIAGLYSEGIITDEHSAREYYDQLAGDVISEIELMYRLRGHTNIVSYEDHMVVPRTDGPGYDILIRMELLKSMDAVLRERALTVADVTAMGIDVCSALEVLGREKLVHRDLKPANIFVNDAGDYKIGDFGVARSLEKQATVMTRKGTFSYMAPELYYGGAADASVDTYALGLIMYRLLNGNRSPFLPVSGDRISYTDNENALMRRLNGEALPAPAFADTAMSEIILRACAYDPAQRWRTPTAFRNALISYSGGARTVPIIASPTEKTPVGPDQDATVLLSEQPSARPTAIPRAVSYAPGKTGSAGKPIKRNVFSIVMAAIAALCTLGVVVLAAASLAWLRYLIIPLAAFVLITAGFTALAVVLNKKKKRTKWYIKLIQIVLLLVAMTVTVVMGMAGANNKAENEQSSELSSTYYSVDSWLRYSLNARQTVLEEYAASWAYGSQTAEGVTVALGGYTQDGTMVYDQEFYRAAADDGKAAKQYFEAGYLTEGPSIVVAAPLSSDGDTVGAAYVEYPLDELLPKDAMDPDGTQTFFAAVCRKNGDTVYVINGGALETAGGTPSNIVEWMDANGFETAELQDGLSDYTFYGLSADRCLLTRQVTDFPDMYIAVITPKHYKNTLTYASQSEREEAYRQVCPFAVYAASRTVRVGVYDWGDVQRLENGECAGLAGDYFKLLEQASNGRCAFEFVSISYENCAAALESGQVDAVFGLQNAGTGYSLCSRPVLEEWDALAIVPGSDPLDDCALGYSDECADIVYELMGRLDFNGSYVRYASSELLGALSGGEIEAALLPSSLIGAGAQVEIGAAFDHRLYYLAVSDSSGMKDGLETASAAVSEETLEQLYNTYFFDRESVRANAIPEDEDGETLVAAMNAPYAPFEYYDENGTLCGIDVDIAMMLGEKLGVGMTVVDMPFDELLTSLKTGEADMVISAYTASEDRAQYALFSQPYFTNTLVVAVLPGSAVNDVALLRQGSVTVGVVAGTPAMWYCPEDCGDENTMSFITPQAALQGLIDGAVDCLVLDERLAQRMDGVAVLTEPYLVEEYCVAVSPENPELCDRVNAALAELSSDGAIDDMTEIYYTLFSENETGVSETSHTAERCEAGVERAKEYFYATQEQLSSCARTSAADGSYVTYSMDETVKLIVASSRTEPEEVEACGAPCDIYFYTDEFGELVFVYVDIFDTEDTVRLYITGGEICRAIYPDGSSEDWPNTSWSVVLYIFDELIREGAGAV